jgi:hypothetical protein
VRTLPLVSNIVVGEHKLTACHRLIMSHSHLHAEASSGIGRVAKSVWLPHGHKD